LLIKLRLSWFPTPVFLFVIGYNLINTPHLKPAAELDRGIALFSATIHEQCGVDRISNEQELGIVIRALKDKLLPQLKLWEFFAIPKEPNLALFEKSLRSGLGDLEVS